MKWMEITVRFEPRNDMMVEELISSVFEEAGTGGVAVERPDMEPLEGWEPGPAVCRPDHYQVKGYIPSDNRAAGRCRMIEEGIDRLRKQGLDLDLTYGSIDEEDWAESWKEYFHPEKVGERIVVKPSWRDYQAGPDDIVIEIDPGMAFGTGTHPTTRMCLRMIESHVKNGDRFLDVGTGSGILMLAADKLGAGPMTGTDIDDLAVETARKNLELGGLPPEKYILTASHLLKQVSGRYDVVVANILAGVILELLDDLAAVMAPGGLFICSGILDTQARSIIEKMAEKGFRLADRMTEEAWSALAGEYSGD